MIRAALGLAILVLAVIATVQGCASKPEPLLTPGSRLIFHNGSQGVWSVCDRTNRIYMTGTGQFQVIPSACPDGQP